LQPKKPRPIFVGGVHGVGKTTLCNELALEFRIPHLTASNLIKEHQKIPHSQHKVVHDIEGNQGALVEALSAIEITSLTYILDGHYTLIDSENEVKRIPLGAFTRVSPLSLVIVTGKPCEIKERLQSRDSTEYTVDFIEYMQELEIKHAQYIAQQTGAHLEIVSAQKVAGLKSIIESLFA